METKQKPVAFDDYVETYQKEIQSSIDFIGQKVDFFIELKALKIIDLAKKYFSKPTEIKILDIGSGIGLTDRILKENFRNLYGIDVEGGVVSKAKLHNPEVKYKQYDGKRLPFSDCEMDMVFTINVMHHMTPDKHNNFLKEMVRVIRKGGIITVFEHNPYNPLTRKAVSNCEFDRDAILIKKNYLEKKMQKNNIEITESSYIVFFPFKGKLFRTVEDSLSWLPLGAQYLIVAKKND